MSFAQIARNLSQKCLTVQIVSPETRYRVNRTFIRFKRATASVFVNYQSKYRAISYGGRSFGKQHAINRERDSI